MKFFIISLFLIGIGLPAISQVNLNSGLIAYYPLDGNANDLSGNGNNGVIIGSVQPTTDRNGNANSAMYFDGTDYIMVNDNGNLSPASISVCAWVYTQSGNAQAIAGKIDYNTGNAAAYLLGLNYDVQTGFFFGVDPAANGSSCFQQYPYNPNNPFAKSANSPLNGWHCLVGTFDNAILKFYEDGVLIDTKISPANTLLQCSNTEFFIGTWWLADQIRFIGKIDEVRVYNRALSTAEIQTLCDVPTSTTLCTGSLGDPVVNITFGAGANPGQPLSTIVPGASTTLGYIPVSGNPANPTPVDGQYTITNNVPYNSAWFSGALDHTPNDNNGYMAFYNSSVQPGEFYSQTVGGLCGSTTYEFAAWIANVLDPAQIVGVTPDITFRIEQTDGTILGVFDTGPVPQNSTMTWQQYGFYFTTPAAVNTVVLKMINNSPGGTTNVGNDLAIDDITFRPCGPLTTASFLSGTVLSSTTICEGSNVTLYGSSSNGYLNPAYLWQTSSDSGKTWTDIPNSNTLQISTSGFTNGKQELIIYRMLTGEASNINSANCRVSSNIINLTINPNPQGSIVGKNSCVGQPVTMTFIDSTGTGPFSLTIGQGANLYNQSNISSGQTFTLPSVNSNATYNLASLSDANGCASSALVNAQTNITVSPLPQGGITGGTACQGDTTRLTFTGSQGRPPYTVVLSDGTNTYTVNNIPGNGPFVIANSFNTGTKTYTLLSITDSNNLGCTNLGSFVPATATLAVLPAPQVQFNALPAVCNLDSSFQLLASEQTGLPGNAVFSGPGVSSTGLFSPRITGPGSYTIKYLYAASNGCSDSASQTIVVNPNPIANAGPDILACINTSIQLNATGGTAFQWMPPQGLSNTAIPNPVASISNTITYIVTVSNSEGCSSSDTVEILVSPLGKDAYKVANAFTPNGDGLNDCFGIQRWGAVQLQDFSIYNRWGQKVFSTRNPSECWDGTFHSIPQPSGGYVYIIKATTVCGNVSLKGTVILVR